MPKGFLDEQKIAIPCPGCGKKNEKSIGWVKANDQMTCSGCGRTVHLERDQLLAGVKGAEDQIAQLRKTIANANKRLR